MLEGVLAQVLTSVLGNYVKESCFSSEKIHVAVWSGYVVLENVELKEEVFTQMGLPMTVRRGCIGRLELQIPWNKLGSSPVVMVLDRVYLVAETKVTWDAEETERLAVAKKRSALDSAELWTVKREITANDESFTTRLVNKIVDNLQIHIREVHFRYEDHFSSPSGPVSLGVTIESLHVQSTDDEWRPSFVDPSAKGFSSPFIYKVLQINNLAVYMNSSSIGGAPRMEFVPHRTPAMAGGDRLLGDTSSQAALSGHRPDEQSASDPGDGRMTDTQRGQGDVAASGRNAVDEKPYRIDYASCSFEELESELLPSIAKRSEKLSPVAPALGCTTHESGEHYVECSGTAGTYSYALPTLPDEESMKTDLLEDDRPLVQTRDKEKHLASPQGRAIRRLDYLLFPVNVSLKFKQNRDPRDVKHEQTNVEFVVEHVRLDVSDDQYHDLLYLSTSFATGTATKKYFKYRPQNSVLASPMEWWDYCISATLDEIRNRRTKWDWDWIKRRSMHRRQYMFLWKRHLMGVPVSGKARKEIYANLEEELEDLASPRMQYLAEHSEQNVRGQQVELQSPKHRNRQYYALSDHESKYMRQVEDERSLEDILFFRSLAEQELKIEEAASARVSADANDGGSSQGQRRSLLNRIGSWVHGDALNDGGAQVGDDGWSRGGYNERRRGSLDLSDADRDELMRAFDYNPELALEERPEPPAAYIHTYLKLHMKSGSFCLSTSAPEGLIRNGSRGQGSRQFFARQSSLLEGRRGFQKSSSTFLQTVWTGLQLYVKQRSSTMKMNLSLNSLEAFDKCARHPVYSRLLKPKGTLRCRQKENDKKADGEERLGQDCLFTLSFETFDNTKAFEKDSSEESTKPIVVEAMASMQLDLQPLEVTYAPTSMCWDALSRFLNSADALLVWKELQVAAMNDLDNLKVRTEAKLEYLMANRFALAMDVHIQAPIIVIPEDDNSEDCARLVVDLGLVTLKTESFASPEKLALNTGETKQKSVSEAPQGEYPNWETNFYDAFRLDMTDLQVLLCPKGESSALETWQDRSQASFQGMHLVAPFDINVMLRTSAIPEDATLTRLIVVGILPELHMHLNAEKLARISSFAGKLSEKSEVDEDPGVSDSFTLSTTIDVPTTRDSGTHEIPAEHGTARTSRVKYQKNATDIRNMKPTKTGKIPDTTMRTSEDTGLADWLGLSSGSAAGHDQELPGKESGMISLLRKSSVAASEKSKGNDVSDGNHRDLDLDEELWEDAKSSEGSDSMAERNIDEMWSDALESSDTHAGEGSITTIGSEDTFYSLDEDGEADDNGSETSSNDGHLYPDGGLSYSEFEVGPRSSETSSLLDQAESTGLRGESSLDSTNVRKKNFKLEALQEEERLLQSEKSKVELEYGESREQMDSEAGAIYDAELMRIKQEIDMIQKAQDRLERHINLMRKKDKQRWQKATSSARLPQQLPKHVSSSAMKNVDRRLLLLSFSISVLSIDLDRSSDRAFEVLLSSDRALHGRTYRQRATSTAELGSGIDTSTPDTSISSISRTATKDHKIAIVRLIGLTVASANRSYSSDVYCSLRRIEVVNAQHHTKHHAGPASDREQASSPAAFFLQSNATTAPESTHFGSLPTPSWVEYLQSSVNFSSNGNGKSGVVSDMVGDELLKISYVTKSKQCPQYQGISEDVNAHFGSMDLYLEQESIVWLLKSVEELREDFYALHMQMTQDEHMQPTSLETEHSRETNAQWTAKEPSMDEVVKLNQAENADLAGSADLTSTIRTSKSQSRRLVEGDAEGPSAEEKLGNGCEMPQNYTRDIPKAHVFLGLRSITIYLKLGQQPLASLSVLDSSVRAKNDGKNLEVRARVGDIQLLDFVTPRYHLGLLDRKGVRGRKGDVRERGAAVGVGGSAPVIVSSPAYKDLLSEALKGRVFPSRLPPLGSGVNELNKKGLENDTDVTSSEHHGEIFQVLLSRRPSRETRSVDDVLLEEDDEVEVERNYASLVDVSCKCPIDGLQPIKSDLAQEGGAAASRANALIFQMKARPVQLVVVSPAYAIMLAYIAKGPLSQYLESMTQEREQASKMSSTFIRNERQDSGRLDFEESGSISNPRTNVSAGRLHPNSFGKTVARSEQGLPRSSSELLTQSREASGSRSTRSDSDVLRASGKVIPPSITPDSVVQDSGRAEQPGLSKSIDLPVRCIYFLVEIEHPSVIVPRHLVYPPSIQMPSERTGSDGDFTNNAHLGSLAEAKGHRFGANQSGGIDSMDRKLEASLTFDFGHITAKGAIGNEKPHRRRTRRRPSEPADHPINEALTHHSGRLEQYTSNEPAWEDFPWIGLLFPDEGERGPRFNLALSGLALRLNDGTIHSILDDVHSKFTVRSKLTKGLSSHLQGTISTRNSASEQDPPSRVVRGSGTNCVDIGGKEAMQGPQHRKGAKSEDLEEFQDHPLQHGRPRKRSMSVSSIRMASSGRGSLSSLSFLPLSSSFSLSHSASARMTRVLRLPPLPAFPLSTSAQTDANGPLSENLLAEIELRGRITPVSFVLREEHLGFLLGLWTDNLSCLQNLNQAASCSNEGHSSQSGRTSGHRKAQQVAESKVKQGSQPTRVEEKHKESDTSGNRPVFPFRVTGAVMMDQFSISLYVAENGPASAQQGRVPAESISIGKDSVPSTPALDVKRENTETSSWTKQELDKFGGIHPKSFPLVEVTVQTAYLACSSSFTTKPQGSMALDISKISARDRRSSGENTARRIMILGPCRSLPNVNCPSDQISLSVTLDGQLIDIGLKMSPTRCYLPTEILISLLDSASRLQAQVQRLHDPISSSVPGSDFKMWSITRHRDDLRSNITSSTSANRLRRTFSSPDPVSPSSRKVSSSTKFPYGGADGLPKSQNDTENNAESDSSTDSGAVPCISSGLSKLSLLGCPIRLDISFVSMEGWLLASARDAETESLRVKFGLDIDGTLFPVLHNGLLDKETTSPTKPDGDWTSADLPVGQLSIVARDLEVTSGKCGVNPFQEDEMGHGMHRSGVFRSHVQSSTNNDRTGEPRDVELEKVLPSDEDQTADEDSPESLVAEEYDVFIGSSRNVIEPSSLHFHAATFLSPKRSQSDNGREEASHFGVSDRSDSSAQNYHTVVRDSGDSRTVPTDRDNHSAIHKWWVGLTFPEVLSLGASSREDVEAGISLIEVHRLEARSSVTETSLYFSDIELLSMISQQLRDIGTAASGPGAQMDANHLDLHQFQLEHCRPASDDYASQGISSRASPLSRRHTTTERDIPLFNLDPTVDSRRPLRDGGATGVDNEGALEGWDSWSPILQVQLSAVYEHEGIGVTLINNLNQYGQDIPVLAAQVSPIFIAASAKKLGYQEPKAYHDTGRDEYRSASSVSTNESAHRALSTHRNAGGVLEQDEEALAEDRSMLEYSCEPGHFEATIKVELSLRCNYYNLQLVAWEPLLEPWSTAATLTTGIFPSGDAERTDESGLDDIWILSGGTRVHVTSPDVLNINITGSLTECIASALRSWRLFDSDKRNSSQAALLRNHSTPSARDMRSKESMSLYWLENKTGVKLWYWGPDKVIKVLEPGAEEPLNLSRPDKKYWGRRRSSSSFDRYEAKQFTWGVNLPGDWDGRRRSAISSTSISKSQRRTVFTPSYSSLSHKGSRLPGQHPSVPISPTISRLSSDLSTSTPPRMMTNDHRFTGRQRTHYISLSLQTNEGTKWKAIQSVPLDGSGPRIYPLVSTKTGGRSSPKDRYREHNYIKEVHGRRIISGDNALSHNSVEGEVVVEAIVRHGCRVLQIRSTMVLVNHTTLSLGISIAASNSRSAGDVNATQERRPADADSSSSSTGTWLTEDLSTWKAEISPGESLSIPVHLCNLVSRVIVKPIMDGSSNKRTPTHFSSEEVPMSLSIAGGATTARAETPVIGIPFIMQFDAQSTETGDALESAPSSPKEAAFSDTHSIRIPAPPLLLSALLTADENAEKLLHKNPFDSKKGKHVKTQTMKLSRHLRILSFHPPFILVNSIDAAIDFKLESNVNSKDHRVVERLEKGRSFTWHECGWRQAISLQIRLPGFRWSEPILIKGQSSPNEQPTVQSGDTLATQSTESGPDSSLNEVHGSPDTLPRASENGERVHHSIGHQASQFIELEDLSVENLKSAEKGSLEPPSSPGHPNSTHAQRKRNILYVSADTEIKVGGVKQVTLFVPYTITNHSGLPLVFQHDPDLLGDEYQDSLLAGQEYLSAWLEAKRKGLQSIPQRQGPTPVPSSRNAEVKSASSGKHTSSSQQRYSGALKQSLSDPKRHEIYSDDRNITRLLLPPPRPVLGIRELLNSVDDFGIEGTDNNSVEDYTAVESMTAPISQTGEGYDKGFSAPMKSSERSHGGYDRELSVDGAPRQHRTTYCSYTSRYKARARICVRMLRTGIDTVGAAWSDPFGLDSAGTTGVVEVCGADRRKGPVYTLGVSIDVAKPPFHRTKRITLEPRYLLVNCLRAGQTLDVRQRGPSTKKSSPSWGDTGLIRLHPGTVMPFHWPHAESRKLVQVKFTTFGWEWSGAFVLEDLGEFCLRLRNEHTMKVYFLRVEVTLQRASLIIIFRPENSEMPPYRVENYSLQLLRIGQKRVPVSEMLLPYHSVPYTWDEPTKSQKLVVYRISDKDNADLSRAQTTKVGEYDLNRFQRLPDALGGQLLVEIIADGPTRVLRFMDGSMMQRFHNSWNVPPGSTSSVMDALRRSWWSVAAWLPNYKMLASRRKQPLRKPRRWTRYGRPKGTVEEQSGRHFMPDGTHNLQLMVNVAGVGISVIDKTPKEILYASVSDIHVVYSSITPHSRARQADSSQGLREISTYMKTSEDGLLTTPDRDGRSGLHTSPVVSLQGSEVKPKKRDSILVNSPSNPSPLLSPEPTTMYGSYRMSSSRVATCRPADCLELRVRHIQVDNQKMPTMYPVMVYSSGGQHPYSDFAPKASTSHARNDVDGTLDLTNDSVSSGPVMENPVLNLCFVRRNDYGYVGIEFIRYISASLLPIDLSLDGETLSLLLRFGFEVSAELEDVLESKHNDTPEDPISVAYSKVLGENEYLIQPEVSDAVDFEEGMEYAAVSSLQILAPSREFPAFSTNGSSFGKQFLRQQMSKMDQETKEESASRTARTKKNEEISSFGESLAAPKKLYIEEMHIHPILLLISFAGGSGLFGRKRSFVQTTYSSAAISSSKGAIEDDDEEEMKAPLRSVLNAMGATLATIENAPITFNALTLTHSFATPDEVIGQMAKHYLGQALRQGYILLGSADVLGNPVGLLRNVGAGVRDFFYEPAMGLTRSPIHFGAGLYRGTSSLLRYSLVGLSAATSRIFASIAVALASASDTLERYTNPGGHEVTLPRTLFPAHWLPEYRSWGSRNSRKGWWSMPTLFERWQGVATSLLVPLSVPFLSTASLEIFSAAVKATRGLVLGPMNGAELDGFAGFLKGLSAGVLGFIIIPSAAMFSFMSRTSASIRYAVDKETKRHRRRRRPPRYFVGDSAGALTTYSFADCVGHELLIRVRSGMYRSDGYIGHLDLGKMMIVLTPRRILYCFNEEQYCEVSWEVELTDILYWTQKEESLEIIHLPQAPTISTPKPTGHFSFSVKRRTVDCQDREGIEWLVQALAVLIPEAAATTIEDFS